MTYQCYILHCSKWQKPGNWDTSEKLEIFSAFIGLRFLLIGVDYCFLLPVVDDAWIKSDIPLQKTRHIKEAFWIYVATGHWPKILGFFLGS